MNLFSHLATDALDVLYEESFKILITVKKVSLATLREIAYAMFS